MPYGLPQSVWDERALAVGIRWLEPVNQPDAPLRVRPTRKAECLICGKIYEAWPGRVGSGSGCKNCLKVSFDEWKRRAALSHREWLEEPKNSQTPALARCLVCGYESPVRPTGIENRECLRCLDRAPLTQEEWEARANELDFTWTGTIVDSDTLTQIKCLRCKDSWNVRPRYLRDGYLCKNHKDDLLVYLLQNPSFDLVYKIGVTYNLQVRKRHMSSSGFSELIDTEGPMPRKKALHLEEMVTSWIRRFKLCPAGIDVPHKEETFQAQVQVSSIQHLLMLTREHD